MNLIGRVAECRELKRLKESDSPEFVAVYGRRRVGKTYLVKEFFNYSFTFYTSGLARGSMKDQLRTFWQSMIEFGLPGTTPCPEDWFEAFDALKTVITSSKSKRKVVFIDELPWLDTQKSKFVTALDRFWNTWASEHPEILLIVCGSAASWMVKNIIRNKGGLHNRITSKIKLLPFTLTETSEFLNSKKIRWNRKLVAETYMILGGVPYYLSLLDKNLSLYQNIDDFFFSTGAKLEDEFDNLYSSLFRKSSEYVKIVEILSKKKSGYIRNEIVAGLKCKDGGSLTRRLEELEHCGFIRKYRSLGETAYTYQLVDFFTLFYLQFVKKQSFQDNFTWTSMIGTHPYSTWKGLAFEKLCFSQADKIRSALGISGVITQTFPFYDEKMQLDMVIVRKDNAVSLCEMKWSEGLYALTSIDKTKIESRKEALKKIYNNKVIFVVFVTSSGLVENDYTRENVNGVVALEDLF